MALIFDPFTIVTSAGDVLLEDLLPLIGPDEFDEATAWGATFVTWTIRYDTDRSAAGTEVITGGTVTTSESGVNITSFNNPNIPADSWVWIETTAQSGTVAELSIAISGL